MRHLPALEAAQRICTKGLRLSLPAGHWYPERKAREPMRNIQFSHRWKSARQKVMPRALRAIGRAWTGMKRSD